MKFLRSGYLYIMSIIASIIPRYVKSASDVRGVKISSDRGSTITKESKNEVKINENGIGLNPVYQGSTLLHPKSNKESNLSPRQLRHNASIFRFFFPRRYSRSQSVSSLDNRLPEYGSDLL